jgi:hypothetical protein
MDNLDEIQIRHRFEAVQTILLQLVNELDLIHGLVSTRAGHAVTDADVEAHNNFFNRLRYEIAEIVP